MIHTIRFASVPRSPLFAFAVTTKSAFGLSAIRTAEIHLDWNAATMSAGSWHATVIALIAGAVLIMWVLRDRRSKLERDLLEAFLEHIPDHVYFKDCNSRFICVNKAMANYFGLKAPQEALSKSDADIFSSEHAVEALESEREIMRTGKGAIGIEEKETWPDGHESWVLTTKVPLKDRRGRVIGTMGISHDITERKQAEARIQYMALHDILTGLPNRVLLMDRITQAIALAHRNKRRVAVLMLDLDRFKSVNDSYGHYVGDRLLETVAKRLKSCLRESDIVARWGGDEFVICLPEVDNEEGVQEVAKKILVSLSEALVIEGHQLQTCASIGICQYPMNGESPEALLEIADDAMYEAKKSGRGTYSFFTPELTQATRRRKRLELDVRQAGLRGEFELYYQPLLAIPTRKISGVEALLRWNHPDLGTISPNEFIPLLEELGLMAEVGAWVLKSACLQSATWQRQGLGSIRVAVNVSAQQFYRGDIVDSVHSALRETGLAPQLLELELTESLTLGDSEASISIMRRLKQLGVSLSLDDFGIGWSSLSYLRRFPLDRIKIDRSFLRELEANSSSEALVRSILNLGRNLGLSCIAEGVETQNQLDYLTNQRCAEIQGFIFSRALPASECTKLISAGDSLELEKDSPACPRLREQSQHCFSTLA